MSRISCTSDVGCGYSRWLVSVAVRPPCGPPRSPGGVSGHDRARRHQSPLCRHNNSSPFHRAGSALVGPSDRRTPIPGHHRRRPFDPQGALHLPALRNLAECRALPAWPAARAMCSHPYRAPGLDDDHGRSSAGSRREISDMRGGSALKFTMHMDDYAAEGRRVRRWPGAA